jgi:pimeloyl-ACP methyl ester carboxylesterase
MVTTAPYARSVGAVPTVTLNGIDVYYERDGSGPPLLFCNGSGATLETSALLIEQFRQHFDVVAHDQRGLGRTSIPDEPFTMAQYAADAAALLDHVGWATSAVVGVSFGGMVAQEYAVTFPERVSRLALVCTSSGGTGKPSYPLHELATLPAEEQAAIALRLLDTRFSPEWLAEHPHDMAMVQARADRPVRTGEQRRGELAQLDARSRHDVWERLPKITAPTLVAGGRYDGIAPPANSEAIASQIPGAELRLYEGGHLFFVQDRTAMPEILAFLAG